MAVKLYEESNIQAIANAIRAKNGTENTYKTSEMAAAIEAIEVGGGDLPEEAFVISGNCQYRFSSNSWNWFIEMYGDRITTKDITSPQSMFTNSSELEEIPFDINFLGTNYETFASMFSNCTKLKSIGKIKNAYPSAMSNMFLKCENLRYLPEFENLNLDRVYTYSSTNMSEMFANCYSLRNIPEDLLKKLYNPLTTSYIYNVCTNTVRYCYVLDEIRGLSPRGGKNIKTNMLGTTFNSCYRLKDIIFDTQDDGTPYVSTWAAQTIDLTNGVGWCDQAREGVAKLYICGYNSGVTEDKMVTDDATYQALKNDPDWFTMDVAYSRYNHDSAVNTINSLPDTSAYGTNTIKFKGAAGSATDGGAINTLTEEEIAVAAAKGWTVTLV